LNRRRSRGAGKEDHNVSFAPTPLHYSVKTSEIIDKPGNFVIMVTTINGEERADTKTKYRIALVDG
jgi:hypothetical protein